jgi:hypothetical protein
MARGRIISDQVKWRITPRFAAYSGRMMVLMRAAWACSDQDQLLMSEGNTSIRMSEGEK